uniref:Mitochondrial 2-oxodicarboxylate carrier n=1 Tax=Sinocyclocheilus anshuiensis TaxID=1608454 RepID=A0A671L345_9TELE
ETEKSHLDIILFFRFQIQRGKGDPNSYKGLGDRFKTIIRTEVVKVSLQANRDSFKVQPSTFGLTSTLGWHGVFNMIYFGFYFNIKDAIPASPVCKFQKFAIGLVSGMVSSCVNIPFDVAKSRIQGPQSVPGEIKYRSCFQTMALVYREEGLIPKIMRLGPGGAVMLLVYEYVSDWLQKNL